jgi:hypothetical protein
MDDMHFDISWEEICCLGLVITYFRQIVYILAIIFVPNQSLLADSGYALP